MVLTIKIDPLQCDQFERLIKEGKMTLTEALLKMEQTAVRDLTPDYAAKQYPGTFNPDDHENY